MAKAKAVVYSIQGISSLFEKEREVLSARSPHFQPFVFPLRALNFATLIQQGIELSEPFAEYSEILRSHQALL